MTTTRQTVSFLGLGEMGSALARAVIRAGHPTTVWNRSPAKATALIDDGARAARRRRSSTVATTHCRASRAWSSPTSATSSMPAAIRASAQSWWTQRLIHRQIHAGHGSDGFARTIDSIKNPEAA